MIRPERTSFSTLDFTTFRAAHSLEITPKFQRRKVWKPQAKAFLIETILLGLPVPPIYLRVTQNAAKTKTIREVVDGQQRISAVLEFMDDGFRLSKSVDEAFKNKTFSQLESADQDRIRNYSFTCEVLYGVSDADVLKIFARVNVNAIKLNGQELRNGKWFGFFKQTSYALALEHIEFWRRAKIIGETGIARMQEVEFTSELLIAMMDGLQDKKKSLDRFYEDYDDEFPQQRIFEKRFRVIIDEITSTIEPDNLPNSQFHSKPLFYSLFCAIYHRRYGLPKCSLETPKRALSTEERSSLASVIEELSDNLAAAKEGGAPHGKLARFVRACLTQTDNIDPRRVRLNEIYKRAFN